MQHGHAVVAHEPADGHLQEGAGRNVVAVEDRDQPALGLGQSMVDVAGLGVEVVGPDHVAAARLLGEARELGPPPLERRVPVVLDGVVGAATEQARDRRPLVAEQRVRRHDDGVLVAAKGLLLDVGVELSRVRGGGERVLVVGGTEG